MMRFVPASWGGHCLPYGSLARWPESIVHRVRSYRSSSATIASRIRNFCTLPVTVIGNASTKRT